MVAKTAEAPIQLDDLPIRRADPVAMRALAHQTRLSLLDLLAVEGSATATRCAAVLGESAASCSFHLRQLAKYGFVEEAPGGTGRQRPWRLVAPAQFGEL